MARKKNYDRDQAVEAAMLTFWKKGYGNLGVREIERETAINRFALQTEFGGKQGLFEAALERYLEMSDGTALRPLRAGGLAAIKAFFDLLVTGVADDPRDGGCLMVNTVIENAELGMDTVADLTTQHYANMQAMFEHALRLAQERHEIATDFDIVGGARSLLTFGMGIEVYVRMHGDTNAARGQVDFLNSIIDGWRIPA